MAPSSQRSEPPQNPGRFKQDLAWLPGKQSNGFFLILGASGSGKTETLKVLGKGISEFGTPVLVLDFHGDVKFPGLESVLLSSGTSSTVGLNPMELDSHSVGSLHEGIGQRAGGHLCPRPCDHHPSQLAAPLLPDRPERVGGTLPREVSHPRAGQVPPDQPHRSIRAHRTIRGDFLPQRRLQHIRKFHRVSSSTRPSQWMHYATLIH